MRRKRVVDNEPEFEADIDEMMPAKGKHPSGIKAAKAAAMKKPKKAIMAKKTAMRKTPPKAKRKKRQSNPGY